MTNDFGAEYLVGGESPALFGGEYETFICIKRGVGEGVHCFNPYETY